MPEISCLRGVRSAARQALEGRRCTGVAAALVVLTVLGACEPPDPALMPDEILQSELGLTPEDRVHTVRLTSGVAERADPDSLTVRPGDYVQFVSADRRVHEVAFVLDSIPETARTFLVRTGQDRSTPLLELDARFVVSFEGAPEGRYPYSLVGNRGSGEGHIVVAVPAG